jgi:hypothetical protein
VDINQAQTVMAASPLDGGPIVGTATMVRPGRWLVKAHGIVRRRNRRRSAARTLLRLAQRGRL